MMRHHSKCCHVKRILGQSAGVPYTYVYIYTNLSSTYTNLYIYIYPTAQEPCTEIINSAVADVADMAHVTDGNPNKRCPVLCGLARIPHGVSEASQKNRYLYNYF